MELKPESISARDTMEVRLTGRGIAPGVAMGPAWVVADVLQPSDAPPKIGQAQIDSELLRLKHAFGEALVEIDEYARRIESEFDSTLAGVFGARRDTAKPFCLGRVRSRIADFAGYGRNGSTARPAAVVPEIQVAGQSTTSPARR